MTFYSRMLGVGTISAVAFTFLSVSTVEAATSDDPPPVVEDYDYPGADQIFAQHGIRLLKGDGHILFTECGGGANLVEVWSRTKNVPFCFKITGAKGYLSMDLARVYLIKGDDHALKATMKIKDAPVVVDIPKNSWTSVGEGANPENGYSSLAEFVSAGS
ncbi:hypothetical protein SAMN04489729_6685 [Amycolatopsis lurida]|nr:hypothetical protein [Amycolatopsis lurida]SEE20550.1 hypothetical protein SAMN04489729_6685 [Amycolatopsis lurida]